MGCDKKLEVQRICLSLLEHLMGTSALGDRESENPMSLWGSLVQPKKMVALKGNIGFEPPKMLRATEHKWVIGLKCLTQGWESF